MQGWSYDAAGNLLNDGAHSYTYDAECRIKTVDGTAATYTYGPDGERVRKDTSAGSTEYIYFGGSVIAELNPASGGVRLSPVAAASIFLLGPCLALPA